MSNKRAHGEGMLRLRSDGRWECTLMDGYTPSGKRNIKSFYGKTQAEAKKKRNEYLMAKEQGILIEKEYLFPEWADIWFENHKENPRCSSPSCLSS